MHPHTPFRVPGDGETLQGASGKRRQILLERLDTERVGQLEVGEPAVGTLRVDEEPAVAPEEAGSDAEMGEGRVVEVAQDGVGGRFLHREVVVRARPRLECRSVAARARRVADVRDPVLSVPPLLARRRAAVARTPRRAGNQQRKAHAGEPRRRRSGSAGQELSPQNAAKRSAGAQGHGTGGMGRDAEPARRFGALAGSAASAPSSSRRLAHGPFGRRGRRPRYCWPCPSVVSAMAAGSTVP